MSILDRLLFLIGLRPNAGSRTYEISESLQTTLTTLAKHESRPVDELIPDLLAAGLTQYVSNDKLWNIWEFLDCTRARGSGTGVFGIYQPRDR